MIALGKKDQQRLRELQEELSTFRLGGPPALEWLSERLHTSLDARAVAAYGVSFQPEGVRFDFGFFQGDFVPDIRERQTALWNNSKHTWVYNPGRPERAQRNTVLSVSQLRTGKAAANVSRILETHRAAGIDVSGQVRALVCDGPSLLAFVGVYHPDAEPRASEILTALVRPLRARLRIERQLNDAPLLEASLGAALEAIGAPAFVVGGRGVVHANTSGRALLQRQDVTAASLAEIPKGRSGGLAFDVTKLEVPRAAPHHLAVLRVAPEDPEPRRRALAERWSLTPRQSEVLALLARGVPNKTISAVLGCSNRTTEAHVRALLQKADVESRAALVARFWTAR